MAKAVTRLDRKKTIPASVKDAGKPVDKLQELKDDPAFEEVILNAAARQFNKNKFNLKKDYSETKVRQLFVTGNAYAEEQRLIANKESFIIKRTNVTTKFRFTEKKVADLIYSSQRFSFKELNLFKEIRKEVRYNIENKKLKIPKYTSADIGYYLFSSNIHKAHETGREVYDDVVEFDVRKAYYQAAYNLGYISQEFYLKCIELPKTTRLRLIGSIATSKSVYIYKKGVLQEIPPPEEDEVLRYAWFHICKYIDECMRCIRQLMGQDFLFYWVDGIYGKQTEKIDQIMLYASLKYKLDFEYRPVDQVIVERDEQRKCIKVKAYRTGENPEKPTRYTLNNTGEVMRQLKKFYMDNFSIAEDNL
jgi:hypothetical protein